MILMHSNLISCQGVGTHHVNLTHITMGGKSLLVMVLLIVVCTAGLTNTNVHKTRCETNGPVEEGKTAILNLLSMEPLKTNMEYVYVFREDDHKERVMVLKLYNSTDGLMPTSVAPGYEYAGNVGNILTLVMKNARRDMTGAYYVEDTDTPDPSQWENCFLTVKVAVSDRASEPAEHEHTWALYVTLALLLLLVIFLLGAIIFLILKMRKRNPTVENPTVKCPTVKQTEFEKKPLLWLLQLEEEERKRNPTVERNHTVTDIEAQPLLLPKAQTEEKKEDSADKKDEGNDGAESRHDDEPSQVLNLLGSVKRRAKPKRPQTEGGVAEENPTCTQPDEEDVFQLASTNGSESALLSINYDVPQESPAPPPQHQGAPVEDSTV